MLRHQSTLSLSHSLMSCSSAMPVSLPKSRFTRCRERPHFCRLRHSASHCGAGREGGTATVVSETPAQAVRVAALAGAPQLGTCGHLDGKAKASAMVPRCTTTTSPHLRGLPLQRLGRRGEHLHPLLIQHLGSGDGGQEGRAGGHQAAGWTRAHSFAQLACLHTTIHAPAHTLEQDRLTVGNSFASLISSPPACSQRSPSPSRSKPRGSPDTCGKSWKGSRMIVSRRQ